MVFVLQMPSKSVSPPLFLLTPGCDVCNPCQCGGKWVSTAVEQGCEVTPAQTRRSLRRDSFINTERRKASSHRHLERMEICLSYIDTIKVSESEEGS